MSETTTKHGSSPTTFVDDRDLVWAPRFTAPALLNLCRECNINIGSITSKQIGPDVIIVALWYTCAYQAKQRQISREDFMEHLDMKHISEGTKAMWAVIKDAFPEAAELMGAAVKEGMDKFQSPLAVGESGKSET